MTESLKNTAKASPTPPAQVTVLFFAMLRDWAGQDRITVEVDAGETVGDLWRRCIIDFPPAASEIHPAFAVNEEYVKESTVIADGDEVAFIPPVSGG